MNSQYSDRLTEAGSLDGNVLTYMDGTPVRWNAIYAHEEVTCLVTSDTLFINDGATAAVDEEVVIPAGSTYFGYFSKITFSVGALTAYRAKGSK